MSKLLSTRRTDPRRHGGTIVFIVIAMTVIAGMVAFSIEVGRMFLLRCEVQNAVDAGALAATLKLQEDPEAVDDAAEAARQFVRRNQVGTAVQIPEDAIQVETGTWDINSKSFTATGVDPNAVRVFARQDNEPFFFGRLFSRSTFGTPASAVASNSGEPLDIMMVLDLSGSMSYSGRIEALWAAAPEFVTVIEDIGGSDQIGVMGLAADPSQYDPADEGHTGYNYNSGLHASNDHYIGVVEEDLTTNFNTLRNTTLTEDNLIAGKYTGWTGTGAAIGDATHYLKNDSHHRSGERRIILLMSDGYANKPDGNGPGYARQMADYADDNGVKIYTVSLGDHADVDLMEDIAERTGGVHFDATGTGEDELTERLTDAFRQAAAAIKRSQLVE